MRPSLAASLLASLTIMGATDAGAQTVTSANCTSVANLSTKVYAAQQRGTTKAQAQAIVAKSTTNKTAQLLSLRAVEVVYGMQLGSADDAYRTVHQACSAYIGKTLK